MNVFFTTILVAIVSCAHAVYIIEDSQDITKAFFEEKCRRNSHNNDTFRNLMDVVEPLPECFQRALGYPPPNPRNDYGSFCERIGGPDYYMCLDKFVKKVSPCLDEDEAYLPDFVLTAFNASLESVCGENGLNKITAMINDIYRNNCITSLQSLEFILGVCSHDLIIFNNIYNDVYTIKKNDLCSDLRTLKGCINEGLENTCHEDHAETIAMVLDPYIDLCE